MRSSKRRGPRIILALFLLAIVGLALYPRTAKFYPEAAFEAVGRLEIRFLKSGLATLPECQAIVRSIVDTVTKNCLECRLRSQNCLEQINSRQLRMLSGLPIDTPVMRIPNGVVEFRASAPETAYFACLESQRQTSRTVSDVWACASPDTRLDMSFLAPKGFGQDSSDPPFWALLGLFFIAILVSYFVCYLIVRYEGLHARYSHDATNTGPQKFHATPTPRIGGVAIAAGISASIVAVNVFGLGHDTAITALTMLAFAALPAFGGGLGEDLTRRIGVLARLMLTMAAGVIASILIGSTLNRVGISGIDFMLQWSLFAIVFTAFAVGGIANAINIIDGYNGLAGGYLILVSTSIAWVSFLVGDSFVLGAALAALGAIAGFLCWNWPAGRLFLGDGGAYLLGFWIAEISVLLVVRNAEVSPWFPFTLLVYPIFETLFSIYRRSLLRGQSSGKPDALHFHTLLFRRLIRRPRDSTDAAALTRRNSMVAPPIWLFSSLAVVPATFLWQSTTWLVVISLIFCVLYLFSYSRIVRFGMGRLSAISN